MPKLTKTFLDNVTISDKRAAFWDDELPGFGVRVTPAGAKSFVIRYRVGGGGRGAQQRLHTLGTYGPLTVELARKRARTALGAVANGCDPAGEKAEARAAITVNEMVSKFMTEEVEPKRKSRTAELYQLYFDKHVIPKLGTRRARDVTRAEVAKLHREIGKKRPVTANRVVVTLSGAYGWAASAGEIPEGTNPCKGISRFAEEGRERFLTGEELQRLGASLALAETEGLPMEIDESNPKSKHTPKKNPRTVMDEHSVAAIRLLLLSGCRLREILHLRWSEIDFERGMLFLPDSKTGKKSVVLNAPALSILADLKRVGQYVIASTSAGTKDETPRADLHRPWRAVTKHAGLEKLRLHDLRHTHASIGAGAGMGLPIIGRLLGHRQVSTTAKYAHLAVDPLRAASDKIAAQIEAAIGAASSKKSADVIELPQSTTPARRSG